MSRIAIDAREYTSSTGRYVSRLVQYLEKLDDEHDYIVLLRPADLDACRLSNPRFSKLACPYKEFTFSEQLGFKRQLERLKPDLVHFGMTQQPVWYRGKTVTTVHDLTTLRFDNPAKPRPVFKFKQLVYRQVVKRVARKSAALLTGSHFVKDDLVKFSGIKPDKVTVTYEAADPITDRPEPVPALTGQQFIMYVGRALPHKNLERLVEAFALLKVQHPELLLVLAGQQGANYGRLQAFAERRAVAGVHFTGFVSEGQLRWLYEQCAAYVFPSLSEGFGLPGLEAMAHGAPVVSSNATCLPEVYGEAAHYFDPLDVTAMAEAINEILTDKILRAELVRLGQKQVKKYSWRRLAEQTLAVYLSVLGDIELT
jgi:glycosyltransferase involved in cell wall biosynthesis